jgi:hypothetical protein
MVSPTTQLPSIERIKAWQCIGCGRLDGPQPCLGICQDRKVELVSALAYDDVVASTASLRARADALEALVRQLARTTPRDGGWERSYRALQEQARRLLIGAVAAPAGAGHDA